jgi:hypothetical protein
MIDFANAQAHRAGLFAASHLKKLEDLRWLVVAFERLQDTNTKF